MYQGGERVEHYREYKPRPFTREERDHTTILFGGLTWRHEALLQGVFENHGYKSMPLPNIARREEKAQIEHARQRPRLSVLE